MTIENLVDGIRKLGHPAREWFVLDRPKNRFFGSSSQKEGGRGKGKRPEFLKTTAESVSVDKDLGCARKACAPSCGGYDMLWPRSAGQPGRSKA